MENLDPSETEKHNFETVAKVQEESMRYVSKDMANLARRLKKTEYADNEDMFKSNVVEASFFIMAFKIGTHAFNAMVKTKGDNHEDDQTPIDFFMNEIVKLHAKQMRGDKHDKN